MRMLRLTSLVLAGVVAAVLVAPAPVRAQQVDIKPPAKVKRDKYVITQDEIAEHPDLKDGYDVVKSLRNQWLRVTRGSGSSRAPASMARSTAPTRPSNICTRRRSSAGGSTRPSF